ncbi:MAG TPA: hypothetical protein EYG70_07255, partial [Sulfurimonas sp.]|nr:hypothetical protein [Sulfurimonas sp.]
MKKILLYVLIISQVNLFAESIISLDFLDSIATNGEDFTLWMALFGLGIISFFALFLSSDKIEKFKKKQK